MKRIIVSLFVAGLASGCGSEPPPAEPAAAVTPAPATTAAAPAPTAAGPTISGDPCWANVPSDPFLADSPAGVVERFYGVLQPSAGAGVPEDAALRQYAPMLTVELEAGLVRARAERDLA